MLVTNYSLLLLSFLLALSTAHGQRYLKYLQEKKAPAKPNFEKKASATAQLVIFQPTSSTPIIANTTAVILVDAVLKAATLKGTQVQILTTIDCNGVISYVYSTLGVPTSFIVDPKLYGKCKLVAEAPNDPNYAPSQPLFIQILNPLYFEGTSETVFHTGENLPIYVRPADNAKLKINFVITCGSVVKTIPIVTTTKTLNYVLTPDLVGSCTFTTTNVPNDYIPIDPIAVTIYPSIFFVKPVQNTKYNPGSAIDATLIATDGNRNLDVTVELFCEDNLVGAKTQNIQTTFSFAPSAQIYGSCTLSLGDVKGYYTEETVKIAYRSVLSFVLPKKDSVIVPGTNYDIQVDGTSGTPSVSITVVGKCQVGGSFTEIVPLGVKTSVTLGSEYQGSCTLVATTSTPNFTPATTSFSAFTPLDPAEKAKAARSFLLSGRIIEKTKPYPPRK